MQTKVDRSGLTWLRGFSAGWIAEPGERLLVRHSHPLRADVEIAQRVRARQCLAAATPRLVLPDGIGQNAKLTEAVVHVAITRQHHSVIAVEGDVAARHLAD